MDEYLAHHGIKGMKWGVRRTDAQLGKKTSFMSRFSGGGKPAQKKAAAPPAKPAEKKLSEMSDDELRSKLARFDMEKRYKQYMAEMNPKKGSRFKKVAGDIVESGVKTLAAKGFEKLASNILAKAEDEDLPTLTKIKDVSKLGDKKIEKIIKRLESEKKLDKLLNGEEGKKASKKGKETIEKLLKEANNDKWSELWLV